MHERSLEHMAVTQHQNRLVAESTNDPNPVHDEVYMASIGKYPIIMGAIMESMALGLAADSIKRRFSKPYHLVMLSTEFKDFLYPDEPFSLNPQLDFGTSDDTRLVYKIDLKKDSGKDIASVVLAFTDQLHPSQLGHLRYEQERSFRYDLLNEKVTDFSRATGLTEDLAILGFVLASRSGVVTDAVLNQQENYPSLAPLRDQALFPLYVKHTAMFNGGIADTNLGDAVLFNLGITSNPGEKRPVIKTEVRAYNHKQSPLYYSESVIQTIPRKIVVAKMLRDLPKL